MATVEPYLTASGERRYRVRYRKPDGGTTSKRGFPTKKAAEDFGNMVESEKLRDEYIPVSAAKVTVGELGPDWLARQEGHLKKSAYRPLEASWRLRVQPRWGETKLCDIRFTDVQAWTAAMTAGDEDEGVKPLKASAVIRTLGVLSAILADAVKDRLMRSNPAKGVKLPKKRPARRVYLTHRQVHALAAQCGPRGPVVLLLAYTGLRWSEVVGLRVRNLNLARKRLLVEEPVVQLAGHMQEGTPKSHRKRTVPFPAFLVEPLREAAAGKDRDALLFTRDDGEYMPRPATRDGWFEAAVRKAGIPRVTPHGLRHTAASLAVAAGANVKAVQTMLGHASAAMTLDVYADLFDDDLDSVANALSEAAEREGCVSPAPEREEAPGPELGEGGSTAA